MGKLFAALCAVALCGTILLADEDEQDPAEDPTSTPAATQNAKEYPLQLVAKPGDTIPILWKSTSVFSGTDGTVRMVQIARMEAAVEMTLTIGKPTESKNRGAELAIRRLYGQLAIGEDKAPYDTGDPKTVRTAEGKDMYILPLSKVSAKVELDKLGQGIACTLEDKDIKAIKDTLSHMEEKNRTVAAGAIQGWVRTMSADATAYLPAGEVKVGDTWPVKKRVTYLMHSGMPITVEEASECKLITVDDRKEGRIAKVQIFGKVLVPDADKATEISEYAVQGAMRINLDKPQTWKWHVELLGKLKDKKGEEELLRQEIVTDVFCGADAKANFKAPATQPAGGPAGQPASGPASMPASEPAPTAAPK